MKDILKKFIKSRPSVRQLKKELKSKDEIIDDLTTKIAQKDSKIEELSDKTVINKKVIRLQDVADNRLAIIKSFREDDKKLRAEIKDLKSKLKEAENA